MRTFPAGSELLNPYSFFEEMRRNHPVAFDEQAGLWAVYRHADVTAILGDHQNFPTSTIEEGVLPAPEWRRLFSINAFDPPHHTRLRNLALRAFTPAAVARLQDHITTIVDRLIDAVAGTGQLDLVADIAGPLPTIVIAEMLGVPAEDQEQFRRWSDEVGERANALVLDPENGVRRLSDALSPMEDYVRRAVAERRKQPKDDLMGSLLAAEIDGQSLEEPDLVAFCMLLLIAGNISTTHMIGNGIRALLEHPEQQAHFLAHPAQMPGAIEELLRYDSPVLAAPRWIRHDYELRGKKLERGQRVICWLGAANRDEDAFPDPNRLDLTRKAARQVSFGHGAHYCLGAPLARLEARIALPAILRRLPELALVEGTELAPVPGYLLHGMVNMPMRFKAS
ncbi:cytochrome P450 [Pendulispora rubella]|uniref:Cytochrome P450 n=1 Tax=Pendulispora rubella TaxID=2741070 RepID=A0ABZ2KW42_9BACT